jgi:ketosteroid isomerase-like protein
MPSSRSTLPLKTDGFLFQEKPSVLTAHSQPSHARLMSRTTAVETQETGSTPTFDLSEHSQKGEYPMSQENVTLIQRGYEAFARGDIPTALALMDPTIEWYEPQAPGFPFAGVHRGPQAVAEEVFGVVPTNFEEFATVPQEFVDAGDRVFVLGEFRGKGKASGTPFVAPFVHIATIRNGKMARFQNYTDTGTIAAAIR